MRFKLLVLVGLLFAATLAMAVVREGNQSEGTFDAIGGKDANGVNRQARFNADGSLAVAPSASSMATPQTVKAQTRQMQKSDNPTVTCSSIAPAASPVPTVYPVPSPGKYWKHEVRTQNIGTVPGRRIVSQHGTACTINMAPWDLQTLYLIGADNAAVTFDWLYDAGVTFRDTVLSAQKNIGE